MRCYNSSEYRDNKGKKTCTEFLLKIPKGIDRKKYIGITFVSSQTPNQNNCWNLKADNVWPTKDRWQGKYKLPLQSKLPKLNYIPNLRSEVTTT